MAKKKSFKRNAKNITTCKQTLDEKQDQVKSDAPVSKITMYVKPTNSIDQPISLKICRLCESKVGPFVDMFDSEKILAKKVDDIMPFIIAENDDLPQKICFRCSAKVEEVYEFIQKCVKTQENFQATAGINVVLKRTARYSYRSAWEDKLNEHNMSNDDICNAIIQKAIEGIKNLPTKPLDESDIDIAKTDLRVQNSKDIADVFDKGESKKSIGAQGNSKKNQSDHHEKPFEVPTASEKQVTKTNSFSLDNDTSNAISEKAQPFNIMDHVSMIKVNGVGVLFQCKLCNRNFLVKEVVMNHRCAKNGGKKIAEEEKIVAPPPPKVPLIKYINTKPQDEVKKTTENKLNECSGKIINSIPINLDDDEDDKPLVPQKPKRKIGPASKTRHLQNVSVPQKSTAIQENESLQQSLQISSSATSGPAPTVELPLPALNANSRYKIIQGPNNSLVFIEEKPEDIAVTQRVTGPTPFERIKNLQSLSVKNITKTTNTNQHQPPPTEQPYPVRLIKSGVACNSESLTSSVTTPDKKQSYTIVQTGNPSKLLISTKSQVDEGLPTKRLKRTERENSFSGESDTQKQTITFVNVDPTAQPSYVLPTGNIIQESQISTSTIKPGQEKDTYPCDICGEKFSREKKLQTHIQSHYNQLDEEDQKRGSMKKRKLKS